MLCPPLRIHARNISYALTLIMLATAPVMSLAQATHVTSNSGSFNADYKRSVGEFFGDNPVNEFRLNTPFSTQILDALSMPDKTRPLYPEKGNLGGGFTIVTGCRPHSCTEKVAIVVDQRNNIVIAATIARKCPAEDAEVSCRPKPVLTIYSHKMEISGMAEQALQDWGRMKNSKITDIRHVNITQ